MNSDRLSQEERSVSHTGGQRFETAQVSHAIFAYGCCSGSGSGSGSLFVLFVKRTRQYLKSGGAQSMHCIREMNHCHLPFAAVFTDAPTYHISKNSN